MFSRCDARGATGSGVFRASRLAPRASCLLHYPHHRRLQPAEAEVDASFEIGRQQSRRRRGPGPVPVGVRHPRNAKGIRAIVALPRQTVDDRAARIPEAEELGDLVIRLPRRIVARPAHQLVPAALPDEIQARMTARHHQHGGRQRQLAMLQDERLDVAGEVMDRHERNAVRPGDRLGEGHADEQRAHETRPLRDRDRAEVRPRHGSLRERALHDAANVAQVLAGGQLGDDASPLAVDGVLRSDHVRLEQPRLRRIAGLGDNGRRRLVARCFDSQEIHGAPRVVRLRHPQGGQTRPGEIPSTADAGCRAP
jgi:hypothetical protein